VIYVTFFDFSLIARRTKEFETAEDMNPESRLDCPGHLENNQSPKGITKARKHGKNMRRLVKLVSSAFLNPSELGHLIKPFHF
jgi:hypothetical protein